MYFFLPVCCREMLGSSTLLNVATRVCLLSMSRPEGPRLLAAQPRCSRQGSCGTAGSGNGAAEGASETRGSWGVEFRPPKAPASSTTIEASICSLHRHTSSELCNPVWHFLSRKHTSGFPALLRKPTLLLLASRSQTPPDLTYFTGCCCSGQDGGSSCLREKYPCSIIE